MEYARIAKWLLQDAHQWHAYAGPHLPDEEDGEDASSDTRKGSAAGATSEPTRGETDNPPTPPKKRRLQSVRPGPDADEEGATDDEDRRPTPKKTQGGRPGRPRGEPPRGTGKPEKERYTSPGRPQPFRKGKGLNPFNLQGISTKKGKPNASPPRERYDQETGSDRIPNHRQGADRQGVRFRVGRGNLPFPTKP
jgi:hypothetical protein